MITFMKARNDICHARSQYSNMWAWTKWRLLFKERWMRTCAGNLPSTSLKRSEMEMNRFQRGKQWGGGGGPHIVIAISAVLTLLYIYVIPHLSQVRLGYSSFAEPSFIHPASQVISLSPVHLDPPFCIFPPISVSVCICGRVSFNDRWN